MSDSEPDRVVIPRDAAMAAHTELKLAIKRTGGPEMGAEEACTPLALARQRIESDDELGDEARERVLEILHNVSEERGVEISDAAPLADGTFNSKRDIENALALTESEYLVAGERSPDEEDVFREELHDVAHGMVTTAFIFDTDDGLTGIKVRSDDIQWVDFARPEAIDD